MDFIARITEACRQRPDLFPREPGVGLVVVRHDDWCARLVQDVTCDCAADISFVDGGIRYVVTLQGNVVRG